MTETCLLGCDICHTSVPGDNYPKECVMPDGETKALCMHCMVSHGADPAEEA